MVLKFHIRDSYFLLDFSFLGSRKKLFYKYPSDYIKFRVYTICLINVIYSLNDRSSGTCNHSIIRNALLGVTDRWPAVYLSALTHYTPPALAGSSRPGIHPQCLSMERHRFRKAISTCAQRSGSSETTGDESHSVLNSFT